MKKMPEQVRHDIYCVSDMTGYKDILKIIF